MYNFSKFAYVFFATIASQNPRQTTTLRDEYTIVKGKGDGKGKAKGKGKGKAKGKAKTAGEDIQLDGEDTFPDTGSNPGGPVIFTFGDAGQQFPTGPASASSAAMEAEGQQTANGFMAASDILQLTAQLLSQQSQSQSLSQGRSTPY